MSILNKISSLPFKGDVVIDVQFSRGLGMASIHLSSGKVLTVHINDDGSYTRKDYMNDVKINNRDITINKIIK